VTAVSPEAYVATFVAMEAHGCLFGLYAKLVQSISPSAELRGLPPVELPALLSLPPHEDPGGRVLVVTVGGGQPLTIRSIGPIVVCQRPVQNIFPLPALLREVLLRPLVSAVSFERNAPPLIVLDPVRIASAVQRVSGVSDVAACGESLPKALGGV
jgi:hypothetical protein